MLGVILGKNEGNVLPVADVSCVSNGKKVNLFHAASFSEDIEKMKNSSFSQMLLSPFKKKKEFSWYYAALEDHVVIRAGKLVLKSKIHGAEGFRFIRVPHLGLLLLEKGVLRRPLSGEAAIIGRKFSIK